MRKRGLQFRRASHSVGFVHLRQSRTALVAALLAFMAIFSMNAISGWHASHFHDDMELAHSLSADHDHGAPGSDTDNLVHIAAHCIGHNVGLPGQFAALTRSFAQAGSWSIPRVAILKGASPPSVLRPPEA
jgi:hypothetical protein